MKKNVWLFVAALMLGGRADGTELIYKDRLLGHLVEKVPKILRSFDAESGRFGSGIWICQDQHPMYPLAVVYATPGDNNPYSKDPKLLDVIVKAGDPLIENMDRQGQWVFAKKDGSTWGKIWMPWTYSRWIRTLALIGNDMPAERRKVWTDALTLGYTGISRGCLGSVHDIPAHHAMGLYIAGQVLNRPDWSAQAAQFLLNVAECQAEGGYWSEGVGPVVVYNFVYADALGTYYATARDRSVLPALEKAAVFHRHFTYPGGQNVETIDQRNPYHDTISPGNVGFTFTPAGRAYLMRQWSCLGMDRLNPDLIASLLHYGAEGAIEEVPDAGQQRAYLLRAGGANRATVIRRGKWFVCLSAYTAPLSKSRWIQDRQNLVSIWHDQVGLILGGGNTKLQPGWSNFTVGDPSLLQRQLGATDPNFLPQGELYHVPSAATLALDPEPGLDLTYGPATCQLRLRWTDQHTLEYALEVTTDADLPVAAHLTMLPHVGQPLVTGAGEKLVLADTSIRLTPEQVGGVVTHGGYRVRLPPSAQLAWPSLPHNPYRKDGRATPQEGRIEIWFPFAKDCRRHVVRVEVVE